MSKIIPENDDLCYGCRLKQEKKTSFNHQKPRMKKKLCFSRLLRLLCKLRVSDPDRPLACKDEEEWVFVVALYLFVRIFLCHSEKE